jgi:hypothetical protein
MIDWLTRNRSRGGSLAPYLAQLERVITPWGPGGHEWRKFSAAAVKFVAAFRIGPDVAGYVTGFLRLSMIYFRPLLL